MQNNEERKDPSQKGRILIGRHTVVEALRAESPLEKIIILYGTHGAPIENIRRLARSRGVSCVEADKRKFRELIGEVKFSAAQGVVALVGTKHYVEVDDLLKVGAERGEPAFLLVLDEIEDPQNLGALIRTAECAGVHGVIIPRHHAATVTAAVGKASAGASEYVPVAKVTNLASCLDELKERGLWIVGTDASAEKYYTEIDYAAPLAIVVGSEGKGMRKLVKEKCDFLVKIPLYGKVESLNASVAGALVVYEVVRRRKMM